MYTITCDGYVLDDYRDDQLSVDNPVVNLELNTVGGCTFTIHKNHPYYDKLKKLKSVFEVRDEVGVIFRGRMTEDSADFYNSKAVDLEGAMAYFNDSTIRPFAFPDDFVGNAEYQEAAASGNVIAFFLNWLIQQHNSQVQEFQRFKLGDVTVSDLNNYISRSSVEYESTWETLKSKLFDSALGGYLCIRYETDGNYIDYLSDFTLVNTQEIVFGENLLDLKTTVNAAATYSAIIPLGAKIETTDEDTGTKTTARLTVESLPDGEIRDDIVKSGDTIYSRSAVEAFGWVCAPTKDTTWDDVTDAANLRSKAATALAGDLYLLSDTIEVMACDLHFTNEDVQAFRFYRKVKVRSALHGHSGTYILPKLSLQLHNPQSTQITVGQSRRTLTDINSEKEAETSNKIETAVKDIAENRTETAEVRNQVKTQSTEMSNTASQIVFEALASYLETSAFESFKETYKSELQVLADGISGRVTATEESIRNVDSDLQKKYNEITKYFTFDINGLEIGAADENGNISPNKVVIDNDDIAIWSGGNIVQQFKSDGTALIPTLQITKSLDLLGLQITGTETHISCSYKG